jgi:phosphoribosylformylglycinamidine cyclo-ligase
MKVVKDNLFEVPPVFQLIKTASGADDREMLQVFNMGCRMEIYCDEKYAQEIIDIAASFSIDAQIIGRVEADVKKTLEIRIGDEVIVY